MERIDKIIASQGKYSRSDVKGLVAKGRVQVDGVRIKSSSVKADPAINRISIDGVDITVKQHIYLMLNKPKGYVSATEDKEHQTVLELVPEEYAGRELFPAGRLDRDTTGLMIITDDGVMAHNILSPKKHVQKVYHVTIDIPVTEEMQKGFADGVELNDGVCKAAGLEMSGEYTAIVTLKEGRYHQIKRMIASFGNAVTYLERISFAGIPLDKTLERGKE